MPEKLQRAIYAEQKLFDYCDKSGKQLGWLLSRDCGRKSVTELRNNLGG